MDQIAFTAPEIDYSYLLPQIILLATSVFVLLADVFSKRNFPRMLATFSFLGTIAATVAVVSNFYPVDNKMNMIFMDGFSSFLMLIICLILLVTILISVTYQRLFTNINSGEYYCLLLLSGLGMMFMVAAGHLILMFVALELMSISIYVLTGFHRDNANSIEAALKYFLLGAFASAILLMGFAFIFGATGTLDITAISEYLVKHPQAVGSGWLLAGIVLTISGLGFKVSMVPFHMWTPDVYEGAPTVVTGFMATGVKAAAFAALVRILMVPFDQILVDWTPILWGAAFLTMTAGNILALVQEDIKRMLAYSSIAHGGYLLIGFVAGSGMAQAGILYYLLAYAFMNLGAFGVLALLAKKDRECTTLSDVSGMGLEYPGLGLAMAVFMFSLAGIPPTAGFMGKLYIFTAAVKSGFVWLVVLGAINSMISIYYYFRVLMVMYFQTASRPGEQPVPVIASSVNLALAVSTLAILYMGIFPSFFWELAQNSIFALT